MQAQAVPNSEILREQELSGLFKSFREGSQAGNAWENGQK